MPAEVSIDDPKQKPPFGIVVHLVSPDLYYKVHFALYAILKCRDGLRVTRPAHSSPITRIPITVDHSAGLGLTLQVGYNLALQAYLLGMCNS